jgi:hypothetical protein
MIMLTVVCDSDSQINNSGSKGGRRRCHHYDKASRYTARILLFQRRRQARTNSKFHLDLRTEDSMMDRVTKSS